MDLLVNPSAAGSCMAWGSVEQQAWIESTVVGTHPGRQEHNEPLVDPLPTQSTCNLNYIALCVKEI